MWTSETEHKFLLTPQTAIIKNIVYEVLRECDKRDFVCEKKFVTFAVHLLSLQFKENVESSANFDRKSIEELIEICLNLIIDLNDSPMNITLKMQVFFIENAKSFEAAMHEYHENLAKKTSLLVKEIIEGPAKAKEELVVVQKKIIVDIVLQTALGSPSNQEVTTEVSNALNSVMSEKDFENFVLLEPAQRMEALREIRMIVCGIVLFNKDTGVGNTSEIPDLTKTLVKSFEAIESLLQFALCDIMDRVNILTTAFDGTIEVSKSNNLQFNSESKLEPNEINDVKDLLILNRQHEIYVRKLLGSLKFIYKKIESTVESYSEKLFKLHDIVQYRSAVPSVQIFPKFKELTSEWMMLHSLSFVLSQQNQINNYLLHLSELCRQHQFDEIVQKLLGENQVETDHTRLQKRRHFKLLESTSLACTPNISIVQPPENNSEIEYLGFCTFILAESGILLPSVPEMGTVVWNQKIYGFCSIEAAELFIAKPAKFIRKISELMLCNVQLILFFDIYNIIKQTKVIQTDSDIPLDQCVTHQNGATSVEREVQTDLHPIPFNKDESYVWNLWDWRRQAIKLADLRNKKTTSVQTSFTYCRLDIGNQRYEDRQKIVQTDSSKKTNTEEETSPGTVCHKLEKGTN